MSVDFDTVVIGAGVVGLAIARALTLAGRQVLVIEQHRLIGAEVSSRNSEVIHAGLYYPPGSLRAKLCVRGKELLYDFCRRAGVGHRRIGKLLVATEQSQLGKLADFARTAAANGVADLVPLDAAGARRLEPEVACVAALLSPSTGIIDSHGLMLALQGEAEANGATTALSTTVELDRMPQRRQLPAGDRRRRVGQLRATSSLLPGCTAARWRRRSRIPPAIHRRRPLSRAATTMP